MFYDTKRYYGKRMNFEKKLKMFITQDNWIEQKKKVSDYIVIEQKCWLLMMAIGTLKQIPIELLVNFFNDE